MATEDRFILDLILRSAEEELERDLRIKIRQFLDEALNRAAFKRVVGRTAQCREHVAAHSNSVRQFPRRAQDDLSSREPGQVAAKLHGVTRGTVNEQEPIYGLGGSFEEGEIRGDPESQETFQWEQFAELKNQMSSIANPASREEQLRQFRSLENRIAQTVSYVSSSKVEEWIGNQVDISLKGVKREADRILVEVEGGLLRCKADVYTKLWKGLNDVSTQCQLAGYVS